LFATDHQWQVAHAQAVQILITTVVKQSHQDSKGHA